MTESVLATGYPSLFDQVAKSLDERPKYYLTALKEEGIPDVKVSFHWHSVDKHTEEPVQREESRVHAMFGEMLAQLG